MHPKSNGQRPSDCGIGAMGAFFNILNLEYALNYTFFFLQRLQAHFIRQHL